MAVILMIYSVDGLKPAEMNVCFSQTLSTNNINEKTLQYSIVWSEKWNSEAFLPAMVA